ncbi:MAG: DEAD/DEAH box helicase [Aquificae bacterium]|nr:DEAD/DEAH box helicase [Aquificota bacterium]
MSINPLFFVKEVLEQYGRYIRTTIPLADERLSKQYKNALEFKAGKNELSKGPYVSLNKPFLPGSSISELLRDKTLNLNPAIKNIFPFERLHKHQEEALYSVKNGKHILVSTGTGSGKTESFLLPVIDYCLELKNKNAPEGLAAIIVYPMNALVNDQLERLRRLLAGTGITFGKYTGETPEEVDDTVKQLEYPRAYTTEELERASEDETFTLPLPWEECPSRQSIRERKPRILLTNYVQLEYLLTRHQDLDLFKNSQLKFLIFDELHTYTGMLGSDVACLIRRIKQLVNRELIYIGTSATISNDNPNAENILKEFFKRLFGIKENNVEIITERYTELEKAEKEYIPSFPANIEDLIKEIFNKVRDLHLKEELVSDIPDEILLLGEKLTGQKALKGKNNTEKLYYLFLNNKYVRELENIFSKPKLIDDALEKIKKIGARKDINDDYLKLELIGYLVLGVLAKKDEEPILRPKLHFFVKGLNDLYLSFKNNKPILKFGKTIYEKGMLNIPLYVCRSCGQHYGKLIITEATKHPEFDVEILKTRADEVYFKTNNEKDIFITDNILGGDEDTKYIDKFMCVYCGTIYDKFVDTCLSCGKEKALKKFYAFIEGTNSELKSCASCGAPNKVGKQKDVSITPSKSSEVLDVMIIAQTMLSAMDEDKLKKLLIFTDSRQDAAFQAGWMAERSLKFRLRHLLFKILDEDKNRKWAFSELVEELKNKAIEYGLISASKYEEKNNILKIKWFLLEELATLTRRQRRSALEQLGMAKVLYEVIEPDILGKSEFFKRWKKIFSLKDLQNILGVLLDIYRQKGLLSDELLQREFNRYDKEVREGIITVRDFYRPVVLDLEIPKKHQYKIGLISKNGRSTAQVILKKILNDKKLVNQFLLDLWNYLLKTGMLVEVELKRKKYGKPEKIKGGKGYQLNISKIAVIHSENRYLCNTCKQAFQYKLPNNKCPGYRCNGTVSLVGRDYDNYDVYQFTKMSFTPLLVKEHSAQVPQDERLKAEKEFKKPNGKVNCLVATPTLELGVDIGQLEMILNRNVPPQPANYAQRVGRSGRRHRIGANATYCKTNPHDQHFFKHPEEIIAGNIKIPTFSMKNEPLLRKHIHSFVLTFFREKSHLEEKLNKIFPTFIWHYFGEKENNSRKFRTKPLNVKNELKSLINTYKPKLLDLLEETFTKTWSEENKELVSRTNLEKFLDEMPSILQEIINKLFNEVKAYQKVILSINQKQSDGIQLSKEEETKRKKYENALKKLWEEEQDNYTLTYLAQKGFLPGYSLVKENITAKSLEPYLEISRPPAVALREFTSANLLYINGNKFKIQRMNFYGLGQGKTDLSTIIEHYLFKPSIEKVILAENYELEGDVDGFELQSLRLIDVELEKIEKISDVEDRRRIVSFLILGDLLPYHEGGEEGKINNYTYQYFNQRGIRLINLGTRYNVVAGKIGFPICPVCGEVRSPSASEEEIKNFNEKHLKSCNTNINWYTLHTDIVSDLLIIGNFTSKEEAYNFMEAVKIGASYLFDMEPNDIEGVLLAEDKDKYKIVFYDTVPGGSGFLPLILKYWEDLIAKSIDFLNECDCEKACYKCLLDYRNQYIHHILDRFKSIEILNQMKSKPTLSFKIPQKFPQKDDKKDTESPCEDKYLKILKKKDFPLPEKQFRLNLDNGSYTVADFAYPDKKILIYIDGLSKSIHGNPEQRKKDISLRALAKARGYQIFDLSCQDLYDDVVIETHLYELAILLNSI